VSQAAGNANCVGNWCEGKKGGVCLMEEDYEAYAELLERICWWPTGLRQNAHFREWYASTMNYFMRGRSVVDARG
jgi:hypothetical protein